MEGWLRKMPNDNLLHPQTPRWAGRQSTSTLIRCTQASMLSCLHFWEPRTSPNRLTKIKHLMSPVCPITLGSGEANRVQTRSLFGKFYSLTSSHSREFEVPKLMIKEMKRISHGQSLKAETCYNQDLYEATKGNSGNFALVILWQPANQWQPCTSDNQPISNILSLLKVSQSATSPNFSNQSVRIRSTVITKLHLQPIPRRFFSLNVLITELSVPKTLHKISLCFVPIQPKHYDNLIRRNDVREQRNWRNPEITLTTKSLCLYHWKASSTAQMLHGGRRLTQSSRSVAWRPSLPSNRNKGALWKFPSTQHMRILK